VRTEHRLYRSLDPIDHRRRRLAHGTQDGLNGLTYRTERVGDRFHDGLERLASRAEQGLGGLADLIEHGRRRRVAHRAEHRIRRLLHRLECPLGGVEPRPGCLFYGSRYCGLQRLVGLVEHGSGRLLDWLGGPADRAYHRIGALEHRLRRLGHRLRRLADRIADRRRRPSYPLCHRSGGLFERAAHRTDLLGHRLGRPADRFRRPTSGFDRRVRRLFDGTGRRRHTVYRLGHGLRGIARRTGSAIDGLGHGLDRLAGRFERPLYWLGSPPHRLRRSRGTFFLDRSSRDRLGSLPTGAA
jgi:hypothetical protein